MRTVVEEIKQKSLPVLKNGRVIRSSLFGSYARGEERKGSDIDILVELPNDYGLLEFVDLRFKLEKALKKKVDLVEYEAIKPRLRKYILSNQISLI